MERDVKVSARTAKVIGGIFAASGIVCLVIGGVLYVRARGFQERAARAEGVVVELVEREGDDGSTFAPVFTFTDAAGEEHTIHSSTSSSPPAYQVGEKIVVLYDPGAPKDACIDSFFAVWGAAAIVGGIGLVDTIVGVVLLLVAGRGILTGGSISMLDD